MGQQHPTVLTEIYGRLMRVDEEISELVHLLNRAGFETSSSCQDVNPSAAQGAERWVQIGLLDLFGLQGLVRFAASVGLDPDDWEFQVWSEHGDLQSAVLFPASDVPRLVERLRAMLGA